jgi:hypothetical protein
MIDGVLSEVQTQHHHQQGGSVMRFRVPCTCVAALLAGNAVGCSSLTDDQNPGHAGGPDPVLSVEVVVPPPGVEVREVTLRFRNWSGVSGYLLKPLDGSEWCKFMPHYRWTPVGPAGKPLSRRSRCAHCGTWSNTKWPDDYLVELKPGASWEITRQLPLRVEQPGMHRVRFEYEYLPGPNDFPQPARAWRGRLVSAEVDLFLSPDT